MLAPGGVGCQREWDFEMAKRRSPGKGGGGNEEDHGRAVETRAEVVFCGASHKKGQTDYAHDTDFNVGTLDQRCKISPHRRY